MYDTSHAVCAVYYISLEYSTAMCRTTSGGKAARKGPHHSASSLGILMRSFSSLKVASCVAVAGPRLQIPLQLALQNGPTPDPARKRRLHLSAFPTFVPSLS